MTSLPASLAAGLLLAAIPVLKAHALPAPTAVAVLRATGATKTTAYESRARIDQALPGLTRSPGRPPKPPESSDTDVRLALGREVRDFLFDHPGCVSGSSLRRRYSDRFRLFVLDLCEDQRDVPLVDAE